MKLAAVQLVATPRVEDNLEQAKSLIAQAADEGAELVALPEYFCLMGHKDRDKLGIAEADGDGPIQQMLSGAARRHNVWLIGGTLPLRLDGEPHDSAAAECRALNSTLVFAPDGSRAARYDKVHLFRFDDGERRYDEAATLRAGREPRAFDVTSRSGEFWRVGLSVCYDLRFPELYRALMRPEPCDLIVVPAAFTYPTGQAHWELLLRARAVENQCYVLAPAQGGRHENGRRTWGHSMLIDPWGEVLAVQPEGPGVVMGEMTRERIDQVRSQLPALSHRVL